MSERPNIVLVITDQFRGDCLSVTGHTGVDTPNLDALARKGAVFTRAYSSCPSCIAARASLFTGLSPSSTGRLGYRDQVDWTYDDMLAEVLRNSGYQTHCVGKTHFYPQRKHCGFESLDSYEAMQNFDGTYVNDYFEWLREKSGGRYHEFDHGLSSNSWIARPSHLPEELHNNTWVATKALEFVRRRDRTRPFFLNMSFHRPHPPIDPPQSYWDMYRDRELEPVPVGRWAAHHDVAVDDADAWHGHLPDHLLEQARRAYYAQIAHIDNQIGRVMNRLKRWKAGPTAFVFVADHGEMLGDHHLFRKSYAYEGSARIPLVVCLPDEASGRVVDVPAVIEDVYPTVLDIAGVEAPGVEGRSVMGLYRGAGAIDDREYVHGEHSACYDPANAMQFLTDGREKYIWYTVTGEEQLFDLRVDPQELDDLAPQAAAKTGLEKWRDRLVRRLEARATDGLVENGKLKAGTALPPVRGGERFVEG